MNYKKMLSLLLAASMAFSMPINVFAAQPVTETENQTEVEPYVVDVTAPILTGITLNSDTVKAGETLTVTIDATEEESGLGYCDATFVNKKTKKRLTASSDNYQNPTTLSLKISEYEPNGVYELVSVQLGDKAGNYVLYDKEPIGEPVDNTEIEQLTFNLSFTVINDDNIPTPTPDPTPSNPDKGTSSNSSSSSSSAVNYESEKPNPTDKKAMEAYNFWQNAKAKVRTTPDGKTMRLFVPKDITYMPASMMETLYREKITLIITHNGKKIVIPAGKAMPKQKLKVYWTFESLEKLYQA